MTTSNNMKSMCSKTDSSPMLCTTQSSNKNNCDDGDDVDLVKGLTAADLRQFMSSYDGFGSFFSEDVEVMIRKPSADYCPPPLHPHASLPTVLQLAERETPGKTINTSVPAAATATATSAAANTNTTVSMARCDGNDNTMSTVEAKSEDATTTPLPPPPPFGKPFKLRHFLLGNVFTFLNHGAFGGALKESLVVKHYYENLMEEQILTFMDREVLPLLVYSTRLLADRLLHCDATDVVLVNNATSGLNCAIASLVRAGDVVAYFDTEYSSVFNMLRERCELLISASAASHEALPPTKLYELPLNQLLSHKIFAADEALSTHIAAHLPPSTTVVVLDHICSNSAVLLPVFSHLIPALRARLPHLRHIIVDGAHGPLQCELNFNVLPPQCRPSCYVGNLHKWFCAPKGLGFMWVREDVKDEMRPLIVSQGAGKGFLSDFVWDGTREQGGALSVPMLLDFWDNYVGLDNARQYCVTLRERAVTLLNTAWGTESVLRCAPFMSLVKLPYFFQRCSHLITSRYLQETLHNEYHIEVPIKNIEGKLYVRCSFFINNDLEEYEKLRDAVLSIAANVRKAMRAVKRQRETNASMTGVENNSSNGSDTHQKETMAIFVGDGAYNESKLDYEECRARQVILHSNAIMTNNKETNKNNDHEKQENASNRNLTHVNVAMATAASSAPDTDRNESRNNNAEAGSNDSTNKLTVPEKVIDPSCSGCGITALGGNHRKTRRF